MTEATPQPVLVYDRIAGNRRKTYLLFGLLTVLLAPYFAYVSLYVALGWLMMMLLPVLSAAFSYDFTALVNRYPYESTAIALLVAFLLGVFMVIWQFSQATRRVLRLAGAVPVGPKQEPELRRSVENLCIGSGLPQPALYLIESPATNAFATGQDPDHAAVVVTRGLLELLDPRELEGVLAHALSQIGNYEIRINTTLTAFVRTLWFPYLLGAKFFHLLFRIHWYVGAGCLFFIFFYVLLPALAGWAFLFSPGFWEIKSWYQEWGISPALFYLMFGLPLYCLFVAPLAGLIVERLVLREQPFLHDANAVLLTRNPGGLARALKKMGAANNARMDLGVALAHLCIVDPQTRWGGLFSVHPPLEGRLELLARMEGPMSPKMLAEAEEAGQRYALTRETPAGRARLGASPLRVEPKSWFSQDFNISAGNTLLTELSMDWFHQGGAWSVQGARCKVYEEEFGPSSLAFKRQEQSGRDEKEADPARGDRGDFVLQVEGKVLARAEKPELPFRAVLLEHAGTTYTLKAEAGFFQRKFVLEREGQVLGTISSRYPFIRSVIADLPGDLPLAFRVFVLWLALVHWD
jgi:heat shock protein HtpX